MSNVGAALGWKFNNEPGIVTADNSIVAWPQVLGAQPSQAVIDGYIQEYNEYIARYNRKKSVGDLCDSICSSCTHLGFTWQADMLSVGAIVAKHHVLEGAPPINTTWTDAENITHTLLWVDFVSLKTRIFDFYEAAFANKQMHREAIDNPALNTVVAIEAYNINTGWPV